MKKNSRYPLKHLSVRVPWHDNAWNGTICSNPKDNSACLILKNCALERDDEKEQNLCGQKIKNLSQTDFPPCLRESGAIMADFSFDKNINHPYAAFSPETHGHLKPTNLHFPSFSACSIPYRWMRKENAVEIADQNDLDYDEAREPELSWIKDSEKGWVQDYTNQKALLNCFYEHLEAEISLVFLYAKQVPFVESGGRVLIGVGRVKKIIPSEKYEGSNKRFSAAYWEHMVLHSVRRDMQDGFLMPYHEALEYQKDHPSFDPAELAVIAPNDKKLEFSYAAEHVSNDTAIRVLLDCHKSLERAQELGIGEHHEKAIQWIHNELHRIQKMRGAYPGMGAALCAFGIPKGHFIAAEIINNLEDEKQNPWKVFEKTLDNPFGKIRAEIAALIPENSKRLYKRLKEKNPQRIDLLHLLSRFDLSIEQAKRMYVEEEREKLKARVSDKRILENPYLIYELNIYQLDPIALDTIDLGLYVKNPPDDLLPSNAIYTDPLDSNRIRALTFRQLQLAALSGHTLLPRNELIKQIRALSIEPKCEVNSDYFDLAEEVFGGVIEQAEMKNGDPAYKLSELANCGNIIRQKVNDRINGTRLEVEDRWETLLTEALKKSTEADQEREEKARTEKIAALKELAASRFSVLIGPAGTGKTTLLTVLASHPEISGKGVMLLAPTGKARVRMEEVAKNINVTAKTLAQYLRNYDRYDGALQRYLFSNKTDSSFETVILDEASMLTEEMLATTLDCLRSAKRFILVGDHRQLPPIGPGRPFFDIIHHLKPENIENEFPKIGKGYAELSIKMRQGGSKREDLQLAEWFSGGRLEPGADQIINDILTNKKSEYLRVVNWENETDFEKKFEEILVEELKLGTIDNIEEFNKKLGSVDGRYFNSSNDSQYFKIEPSVKFVEAWQILSPVREKLHGVRNLNRKIHHLFRKDRVNYAINGKKIQAQGYEFYEKKIPKPVGLEQIVYGDKVINLGNHGRDRVYPAQNALGYLANGEIGVVTGQFKRKNAKYKGQPQFVEIEFSSQKGFLYSFAGWDFNEEGDPPLELAYALTVHKSQGSEFGVVFLIIPNPCFLLTREMLYTALTRQKERVVVLFQGNTFDIKSLSDPSNSDTIRRITNLFVAPELVEVNGRYLEKNLIHQAGNGTMLRSKSELLIYQRLLDKSIEPIYEKKLILKGVEKLPDFTIENSDKGITYYWEHCGMMYDEGYREDWAEKYEWYLENDIKLWNEGGGKNGTLIVTEDKPKTIHDGSIRGAISIKEIDELIKQVFDK